MNGTDSTAFDPNNNPFRQLRTRHLLLWVVQLLFGLSVMAGLLQIKLDDPVWVSIGYIIIFLSLCGLMLWRFRQLEIRLEDVVGQLPNQPNWLKLAGLVLAILLCSLGLFFVSFYLISLAAPQFVEAVLQEVNRSADPQTAFPVLNAVLTPFVIVIVAPITEEFLFRGVLLQRWATKWGIRPALIGSAILFGILHANFVGLTIFGFMMGLLYLKTRTLLIPIACHAFNNALAVGMAALPASDSSNGLTLEQLRQSWWVGIVLLVISLPWLIRFIRKNYPRRDAVIPYLVNRSRH